MDPEKNAQDAPQEATSHFRHAHSKRFYPWGLYSDFVYHPDPYGEEMSSSIDEKEVDLSPVQGLVIQGFILVMLVAIAWITLTI